MTMRRPVCDSCGGQSTYYGDLDTYACEACDVWTEAACGCPPEECPYPQRPAKPSDRNVGHPIEQHDAPIVGADNVYETAYARAREGLKNDYDGLAATMFIACALVEFFAAVREHEAFDRGRLWGWDEALGRRAYDGEMP